MIIGIILTIFAIAFFGFAIMSIMDGEHKGVAVILVAMGVLTVGGMMCVTSIDAGTVGVKDTFGNVDEIVFQPGLVVKNPFTNVVQMNTKTQEFTEVDPTLTS